MEFVARFVFADHIPNAGHPMGNKHIGAQQQQQSGSPILQVIVQLSGNSTWKMRNNSDQNEIVNIEENQV